MDYPLFKACSKQASVLFTRNVANNTILVKKEMSTKLPNYCVSKLITLSKKKNIEMEKYLYGVIITAWKLRPYFHSTTVLTDKSPKHFLQNLDATRSTTGEFANNVCKKYF